MSKIEPMSPSQPSAQEYLWGDQLVEELTGFQDESCAVPRTKLNLEIVVRPTNGLGRVFGAPFEAITTDVSRGGMAFLHPTAVTDRFLAITIEQNDRSLTCLVEVVRCRSVGNYYEIGAKFLRPLDAVPSLSPALFSASDDDKTSDSCSYSWFARTIVGHC